jgi:hypothetical protein
MNEFVTKIGNNIQFGKDVLNYLHINRRLG